MKRNLGNLDRVIRMVLGIVLLYLAFFHADWFSSDIAYFAVVIFGLINVITSAIAFCPLYAMANIGQDKAES